MKIPKQFELGGVVWTVYKTSTNMLNAMGLTSLPDATIAVANMNSKLITEQTFCHELVHAIMFAMGKTNHDEEFVDGFATFLHQYLNTAK